MKVVVTGAGGFIGSNLTQVLLQTGNEVHAIVRPSSDPWRLAHLRSHSSLYVAGFDLKDTAGVRRYLDGIRPDLCVHLAWSPTPGRDLDGSANLGSLVASVSLLETLAAVRCRRVLMAGTCVEYDTDLGYLSETSATKPRTFYAASKLALQVFTSRFARVGGLDYAWMRFFYLHGPYESRRRLVPSVILRLLRDEPAAVTGGQQVKDYLHVSDAVSAILAVATSELSGVVNIGSGQPVTVREIVERIGGILGRSHLLRIGALPYAEHDPMFVCANTGLLRNLTGWSPRFGLADGLADTVAWWRDVGAAREAVADAAER